MASKTRGRLPFRRATSLLFLSAASVVGCGLGDPPRITSDFPSGSVAAVDVGIDGKVHFELRPDPVGGENLWFHFRLESSEPVRPKFVLRLAAKPHQANWDIVLPVFSTDGINWVRAEEVTHGLSLWDKILGRKPALRFRSPLEGKNLWVAYSYPYSPTALEGFLAKLETDPRVNLSTMGRSETGRPLQRISIVAPKAPANSVVWVVAREHPGETSNSYVLEGLLDGLLSTPAGARLLTKYRFEVAPMINIDGVADGLYYRNKKGVDLAKDWKHFESAEMRALHAAMSPDLKEGRVAMALNLHSANHPKSHFFLETPDDWLAGDLLSLKRRLMGAAKDVHPGLQTHTTVETWDIPNIATNYLHNEHGVFCLYQESNYHIGADGAVVTRESLRELGQALVSVLAKGLLGDE